MQLVFLRLCPTCLFLRLILSVSFPVINHNSEDSSFQWLLLSYWIWGSLNLQLVLEVRLIMWTVCPLTGQLALILGTVPFASWLFRSSLGPISTSLLTGKNPFLWRLSAVLIANLRKEGLRIFCGLGGFPSYSGCDNRHTYHSSPSDCGTASYGKQFASMLPNRPNDCITLVN